MIEEIEDNYPDYVIDERGYAWDAWDAISQAERHRHDEILNATPTQLAALDPAGLNDFHRWAYARAVRRAGDTEGYLEVVRLVLGSTDDHRGIDYADAFVAAIEAMATAGLTDEAKLELERFLERWPDDVRVTRLGIYIALRWDLQEATDAARQAFVDYAREPEFLFEIVEDFAAVGALETTRLLLADLERLARESEATALLVDIDMLRDSMPDDVDNVTA